MNWINKR